MWRATLKGLLGYKLRMALTAAAIVLGVAFVTGTYVLTDTLTAFFNSVYEEANVGVDVVVRARTTTGESFGSGPIAFGTVPLSLVDTVARVPGVRTAEPGVFGPAQLTDKEGHAIGGQGPPTLGFSWPRDPKLSPLTLKDGRAPSAPDEVVIDLVSARNNDLAVGDSIKVLFAGPARTFRIVGVVGFGRADNLGGATIAAFELATAQQVLGTPGQVSSIAVAAEEGVSTSELLGRLGAALPESVEAVSGRTASAESADAINTQIGFLGTAILFFAGIALFVGSFIVANTFSIVVNQRTRELGLLRALGATGGQVMRSVLVEAALVGLAASAVGIGAGLLLGAGLRALVEAIGGGANLPGASIRLQPRTVIVALSVGVGVTLVAALVPARRAARLPAVAAMREAAAEEVTLTRRSWILGAVLAAGGLGLLIAGFAGQSARLVVLATGGVLLFLGVARLSPLVARPIARVLGAPLPTLAGVAGRLAQANAGRNPRRTAATAAALMVGLGLVAATTIMAASLRVSLDAVLKDTLRADHVVQSRDQTGLGFSPEVADHVRALPVVQTAIGVRHRSWRLRDETMTLAAVDPGSIEDVLKLGVRSIDHEALTGDAVLVHTDEADRLGLRVGDLLPMELPRTGVVEVGVAGLFDHREVIGESFILSLATYRRGYVDDRLQLVLVKTLPDANATAVAAGFASVKNVFPNLLIQDQGQFADAQEGNVRQIVAIVNALLALAIVIALLGIANTLALSIFERTRELGLLRAVGMTRRQTRRMVRLESVIIALLGALLGVAVGLLLGVVIVRSLASSGITQLAVPAGQLAALVLVAGLAGVVSAAFPARRAARVDVLSAIAFE